MRSQSFLKKRPGLAKWLDAIRNDPCVWCGGVAGTVEHVVPRSQYEPGKGTVHGSSHAHWSNMAMACRRHNSQRGNKGLLVYMLQLHNARTGASTNDDRAGARATVE